MRYRILRPDGEVRWIYIHANGVRNDQGKLYRIAGSAEDITDQVALEEQLRQAQKMEAIGRLAGGVAHDFNNLLTVITGNTEFVLDDPSLSPQAREDCQAVQKAAQKALALTSQLLAFSRKQVLQPRVLVLNSTVANVARMLTPLIGEHIQISTLLAPDLEPVLFDPGQLEQMLMNLAVNARDAMPRGGRLTLETANGSPGAATLNSSPAPALRVRLSVVDTGSGMDAATLARIFEPFFTTKEQGKGTGLGLATVYGIVEQSGGCIQVTSKPGEGTRFDIFLPVANAGPAPAAGSELARPNASLELKILLVEDNAEVRLFTRRALEHAGHDVVEAPDPEIALKLVAEGLTKFELVVTDVVMPKMSGLEMAELLAITHPGLKILFMSGYTDAALVPHGLLPAHIPFLDKPFTKAELYAKIDEAMKIRSP